MQINFYPFAFEYFYFILRTLRVFNVFIHLLTWWAQNKSNKREKFSWALELITIRGRERERETKRGKLSPPVRVHRTMGKLYQPSPLF